MINAYLAANHFACIRLRLAVSAASDKRHHSDGATVKTDLITSTAITAISLSIDFDFVQGRCRQGKSTNVGISVTAKPHRLLSFSRMIVKVDMIHVKTFPYIILFPCDRPALLLLPGIPYYSAYAAKKLLTIVMASADCPNPKAQKQALIAALNERRVNTIAELRRVERIFAGLGHSDLTEPMTSACTFLGGLTCVIRCTTDMMQGSITSTRTIF